MSTLILLLMSVAVAGGIAIACTKTAAGTYAGVFAAVWLLTLALPLHALHHQGFAPFGPPHRDFGGALILLVSPAVFIATIARFRRGRRLGQGETDEPQRPSWWTALGVLVGIVVAVACWLITTDGVIGAYTPVLVSSAISSVLGGALTGLLGARADGGPTAVLLGAVCGGAVAVAVGAYMDPLFAGAGSVLIVALLVGIRLRRTRRRARRIPARSLSGPRGFQNRTVTAAGVGGAAGILLLGFVDATGGVLHTGQPWLLLTQVLVAGIATASSVAVAVAAAVVHTRLERRRARQPS